MVALTRTITTPSRRTVPWMNGTSFSKTAGDQPATEPGILKICSTSTDRPNIRPIWSPTTVTTGIMAFFRVWRPNT